MYLLVCVSLINIGAKIYADIYAATAEIEYLIATRMKLEHDLYLYIEKEEKKLSSIKWYYNLYKRENIKAMRNISNYIGNPINAFITIKRLTTDLEDIENMLTTESDQKITLKHNDLVYPSDEDLTGAAQGLSRLITMYELNVRDLAEGKLNGKVTSSPMSTSDCYILGRSLYKAKEYEMSIPWMLEGYRKYNDDNINYRFTDIDILQYISSAFDRMGDVLNSMQWTQKISNIEPNNIKVTHSQSNYEARSIYEIMNLHTYKRYGILGRAGHFNEQRDDQEISINSYEELCRGDLDLPIEVLSRLTCRYITENHPFLKIAPVKMEMKYLDPEVALFYEIFNDHEINIVKDIAMPGLKRARVTGVKEKFDGNVRVSKISWFSDGDNEVLQRISHRLEHITGLSMKHSDHMQVCNYGIGGYYTPHVDPLNADNATQTYIVEPGKRIATVMLYMSDVPQGGATVFPMLGVRVTPVRGTALLWYNLHASGELNRASLHSACPVLEGSKWVCTKWIHQAGQEFRKPCNLQYQREEDEMTIPPPILKISRDRRLLEEYEVIDSEPE